MLLLVCLSLAGALAEVRGQTPPLTPCPEVFQYWFQNGQWSGHVIVPVEEGVDEVAVVTSLFISDVVPPVPGGLHPTADINGMFRNVNAGAQNIPSIEYKLIFPVQSPLPLLDKITVNNNVICQGIPARVRYSTESTCRTSLSGLLQSRSSGVFARCDSHDTVWKLLGAPGPPPPKDDAGSASTDPDVDLPTASSRLVSHEARDSCPDSQLLQKKKKGTCGIPIRPVLTIYNGMPTLRGDFPWLVALHYKTLMQLLCGATLISPRHVITAAHCFTDQQTKQPIVETDVLALVGKYDLSKLNEPDVQCRQLERIVIYPDFEERTYEHDIAVLVLETRVELNVFVIPVCLFRPDMEATHTQTGTVVGWGKEELTMKISKIPLTAMLPIVSQETCTNSNKEFKDYVTERTFCAGQQNGTGPCNGDSGGGLVVQVQNPDRKIRWYLRGIVSLNLKGIEDLCHLNEYSLFTDVMKYHDWIQNVFKQH